MITIKDKEGWVHVNHILSKLSFKSLEEVWMHTDLWINMHDPIYNMEALQMFLRVNAPIFMRVGKIPTTTPFHLADKKLIEGRWYISMKDLC